MKKIVICGICLSFLFAMTGCNNNSDPAASGLVNGPTGVNDVINARISESSATSITEEEDYFSEEYFADETSESTEGTTEGTTGVPQAGIDVDLTAMSGTMVYSEVYNMMCNPSDYIGKSVKMRGEFNIFNNDETGKTYYACIIKDATACCAQGVEFKARDKYSFPKDYPQDGEDITVTGVFTTYMEGDTMYCTLKDSDIL